MRIAIKCIALIAMVLLMSSLAALADTTSDNGKVVEHLRKSFEETQQMPLNRKLYADNLLVTHNYDPGGHVDTTKFLLGVRKELRAAKNAGLNQKSHLTRFLVDDDTVVATVLQTGKLKNGTISRFYIAYFFKIQYGRITHIETWYDRQASEKELDALRLEMNNRKKP